MEGTYFLSETLALTPSDSFLTITNYNTDQVIISGGVSLPPAPVLSWSPMPSNSNIFVANLSSLFQSGALFETPRSLFVGGKRAIRARYPNGNPETSGLYTNPTGYVSKARTWLPPVSPSSPAQEIHIVSPNRTGHFPTFQLGIGGPVSQFSPPESYWGLEDPVGGAATQYEIVTGLTYDAATFTNRTWANSQTGVVHAFHAQHWGNWWDFICTSH